jgi:hypothetical protein
VIHGALGTGGMVDTVDSRDHMTGTGEMPEPHARSPKSTAEAYD